MHLGGLAFMLLQSTAPSGWQRLGDSLKMIWEYLNYKLPIGNFSVSLTGMVTGILVTILALIASRAFSRFIEKRIAKRQYIDPGIRYTVVRLIWWSDRVTIGTDEGDVHSINLRTTIVMTNDRVAVIVPNSRLVRESLVNWSYGDPRARISIPISVNSNTNVDLATSTLLRAAEGVDDIIPKPEPKVQFLKFGDSSLDFRLLIWTNKSRAKMQIRSDINYRIERLFREAGIELASPHFDVRLHGDHVPLALNGAVQHREDAD